MFNSIYRWMIFKIGDTRWLGWKNFPFIATWDISEPEIKGREALEALRLLRAGDILVLRHDGFASTAGIGGAMCHAALYVGDNEVIEALGDDKGGVVRRHALDCLRADKLMVLRPSILCLDAISYALVKAFKIVGFKYDIYFDFNIARKQVYMHTDPDRARAGLVKFCCTEIPYYCYFETAGLLGITRKKNKRWLARALEYVGIHTGKQLITADMYVTEKFDIAWASKGCTVEWFEQHGCDKAYVQKVRDYWNANPKCNN